MAALVREPRSSGLARNPHPAIPRAAPTARTEDTSLSRDLYLPENRVLGELHPSSTATIRFARHRAV